MGPLYLGGVSWVPYICLLARQIIPQSKTPKYSEEAAEKREVATSTEDLNQDVVGGNIPRTLLKLLTYCRVSDKATCEILLELGKVKVNGEVCDDPVKLVSAYRD